MTCGHCEKVVHDALKSVPGVQAVQIDLPGGRATVESGSPCPAQHGQGRRRRRRSRHLR
ncbi:heavy-metal-associated domain-containing protein [Deinococcus navajonensis]|uniref:Heavy-metal-associated domain-containing protein n=1 Tax=Deinococcus navajonensis TaxID=309884 RepID=A0ABV8XL76_9DEIO